MKISFDPRSSFLALAKIVSALGKAVLVIVVVLEKLRIIK